MAVWIWSGLSQRLSKLAGIGTHIRAIPFAYMFSSAVKNFEMVIVL
jgi:hypothetical protein